MTDSSYQFLTQPTINWIISNWHRQSSSSCPYIPTVLENLIYKFAKYEKYRSKFSSMFCGKLIKLSKQDTEASMHGEFNTIRIEKHLINYMSNLTCFDMKAKGFVYAIGVCSNTEKEYFETNITWTGKNNWGSFYGIGDNSDVFYGSTKKRKVWNGNGQLLHEFKCFLKCDFKNIKNKLLYFYVDGKCINKNDAIKLPNNQFKNWYPCIALCLHQNCRVSLPDLTVLESME